MRCHVLVGTPLDMSKAQYAASRWIDAEPTTVWAFLTDAQALVNADTGINRIEGTIERGSRFRLWSEATGERSFSIRVSHFEPPTKMVWISGMPLALFRGTRTFALAPDGDACALQMQEVFTGLLSGLITRSMPDLTPLFERFVESAKRAAEAKKW